MPKLSLAILFVLRIKKYTTIQQRSVHVTDHGANVAKRRRLARESATFCTMHVPAKECGKWASAKYSKNAQGLEYAVVASSHDSLLPSLAE